MGAAWVVEFFLPSGLGASGSSSKRVEVTWWD